MSNSLMIAQSTRLVGQIIDDLERLKNEFLEVNVEEVLTERPDLAALMLMNLNNIKTYLETAPIMFLSACEVALNEKNENWG